MIMISLMELDVKAQHTHAHALLRECLKKRNIRYDEGTPLVKGRLGKPSLAEHPDVHFNLSHAKGITACVVSDSVCGIDCEAVRPYRENVVRRAFSEEEQQLFGTVSGEERDRLFTRLWTLKEAYVKAIGIGVSYPMDTVEFSFSGDEIISNRNDCRFKQFITKNNSFVVSVCELKSTDPGKKLIIS